MIRKHWCALATGLIVAVSATACSANPHFADRSEVQEFIVDVAARHDFSTEELTELFRKAAFRQDILDAMSRPAERRPWHEYRPIFITGKRISDGVEFRHAHREILARAEETFGVPPEIVTAIIGVETSYGRSAGRHRVLDSLATLAFDYPRRAEFFRSELEAYLVLSREERFDPLSIKGSYAGAMGKPQFIPSSYRSYAVDFDGDDRRDLLGNVADAIGSVANYLKMHGWKPGAPVASRAIVTGEGWRELAQNGIRPHTPVDRLADAGVRAEDPLPGDALATLVELEAGDGVEVWVALDNFYVITRYNRSALYAMAVYQLADEIARRYHETSAGN